QRSISDSNPELRAHLEESATRVLSLFSGAETVPGSLPPGQRAGGFQSIAAFIDHSVPKGEQQKAASLLLRMLEGSTWDLWQLAREQAGEADAPANSGASRFVQNSINALSDSFLYGSPVYLQLDSFKQVQASVFQLTRAPGKKVVYLGSLLLVAGIFSMFYIRERRLWFWLKDAAAGTSVVMAMSTARKTLDFEKEFGKVRDAIGAVLGASAHEAASSRDNAREHARSEASPATIASSSDSQD
ncbi:MAG: cytochrome c biogenesis protein ResB, partial [Burkholderiales bacterium]|nr:cytochrome c biogenesis protein ResB [Burkholderiales bacterium]